MGPLEFVEAAHKQAEQVAQAACEGAEGRWHHLGDQHGGSVAGDHQGYHVAFDEGYPTLEQAKHIALHDPAAVLRRVAAERKLLAGHRATRTAGYDAYGAAVIDTCITCGSQYAPYPCATVRLLAEAWGWQEEER